MANPAVSVILTAHNYGRFLDQCIRSVLGQTFQDFELVIVNDGSTDNTGEVLTTYANNPRITILTLPGVGLAAACNRGISRSRGMFVIRLDADDFLHPHALMVEADVLTSRPEIGLVYPDYYTVDEHGNFLGYTRVPLVQDGAQLQDSNPLAGGAMYRRSCYDALGGYNETLRYQEDYDFWLRFIEQFRAYGVGLPLLSYRQHAGSMSKNRANRSAARRYVKRAYSTTRNLLAKEEALIVIPGSWSGAPERDQTLLGRSFGTITPIGLAIEQALVCAESCDCPACVVVVSDHAGVRRAAEMAGTVVMPATISPAGRSEHPERVEISWLRGFVQAWSESGRTVPSLIVLTSPYCPLRHPERLREAIDTLLIHDCDLVVSVDSEPVTRWAIGAAGLQTLQPDGLPEKNRIVRVAGELLAVRTQWLKEPRPLAESLVGYVELLFPEGWCVADDATFRICHDLLYRAETLTVQSTTYLRT